MLRMAHRILTQKAFIANGGGEGDVSLTMGRLESIRNSMPHCTSIIADNVAEYYQQYAVVDPCSRFPFVVPPVSPVFVEFIDSGVQWGVHATCRDLRGEHISDLPVFDDDGNAICDARWLITQNYFCCVDGVLKVFGVINMTFVEPSGTAYRLNAMSPDVKSPDAAFMSAMKVLIPRLGRIFLLAMSFANCKNVVHRDATETDGPPPKWLRRQKAPVIRYRMLEINPMKEVLRTEGRVETNGLKKALHICRGHFATYTPDKPLFGNIVGTVWKPAHVRGDIKHGAVVKDYSITVSDKDA